MNGNHKGVVGKLILSGVFLLLLVYLFGWMLRNKFGMFVILVFLATLGWLFPIQFITYPANTGYEGWVWLVSLILGTITVLVSVSRGILKGPPQPVDQDIEAE